MTYRELYNEVKNPLLDDKIIKKILENYANREIGLYNTITKIDPQEPKYPNDEDVNNLHKLLYRIWKEEALSITDEKAKQLISSGVLDKDYIKFKNYLLQHEINSDDDYDKYIVQIPENLQHAANHCYTTNEKMIWHYVRSSRLNYKDDVDHRLYINLNSLSGYTVVTKFIEECRKNDLPYYFKFAFNSKRDDSLVIYSSTKNITKYIEILRKIKKENPQIAKGIKNPPILTHPIDGWLGYGTEPKIIHSSYNMLRCNIIEPIILAKTNEWMKKHVNDKALKGKYDNLIEKLATEYTTEYLNKTYNNFKDFQVKYPGVLNNKNEVYSENFRKAVYNAYYQGIKNTLEKADGKYLITLQEGSEGKRIIFFTDWKIRLNYNNQDLNLNIKGLTEKYMLEALNDKEYINDIRNEIIANCRANGISPSKFCMDIDVIKNMMDAAKKYENDDISDITVLRKKDKQKTNDDVNKIKENLNNFWDNVNENEKVSVFEEKKQKREEKLELKNIIIYTAINRNNEIKNRALLIYSNGTIRNVNEEIFTQKIAHEAKKRNITSYRELERIGFLKFKTVNELANNWDNYFYEEPKMKLSA